MLTDKQKASLKKLPSAAELTPRQQSENYKGSKMYIDLGNDLKAFVKEESQKRHITQSKFIRDCIRAEMEHEHEESDS